MEKLKLTLTIVCKRDDDEIYARILMHRFEDIAKAHKSCFDVSRKVEMVKTRRPSKRRSNKKRSLK